MASQPEPIERRTERLVHHSKPGCNLALIHTQLPLDADGTKEERFTTARGVIFERHTLPGGAQFWFKVEQVKEPSR